MDAHSDTANFTDTHKVLHVLCILERGVVLSLGVKQEKNKKETFFYTFIPTNLTVSNHVIWDFNLVNIVFSFFEKKVLKLKLISIFFFMRNNKPRYFWSWMWMLRSTKMEKSVWVLWEGAKRDSLFLLVKKLGEGQPFHCWSQALKSTLGNPKCGPEKLSQHLITSS